MKTYSRICAVVFGLMMTALCVVISVETLLRKIFNHSLAGVDELSGYAIAIAAPLCFAIAAIEQSHIRINLLHMRMSRVVRAVLNVLSAVTLAALSVYLLVFTYRTLSETQLFGAVAQTPWMTPLVWPQSIWFVGMAVFTLAVILLAVRAIWLGVTKNTDGLLSEFGPDDIQDELEAELSDLKERT